jgi:serine/threonine protein kinase
VAYDIASALAYLHDIKWVPSMRLIPILSRLLENWSTFVLFNSIMFRDLKPNNIGFGKCHAISLSERKH